jgi:hypothetical protein
MPVPLTQDMFEALWDGRSPTLDSSDTGPARWLILFSSQRCAPCVRLDKGAIETAAVSAGIPFFVCDATVNRYTPVYCDITRFPTFQLMAPRKVIASLTSSDTAAVLEWIRENSV